MRIAAALLLWCCGVLLAKPEDSSAFLAGDLAAYQDRLDQAAKDYQVEQWLMETANFEASADRLSQKFSTLQQVTYDTAVLEKAKAVFPKEDRARRILEATILVDPKTVKLEKENQDRQDKLVAKSNGFRLAVAGEKEPISKALYNKKLASTKKRSEREALWKKHNSLRANQWLEWGFRDLLRSRNEEGIAAGFPNYYEYRFFRNQLDLSNYRSLIEEIKSKLAPKARTALQAIAKKQGIKRLAPWDLRFLREQASNGEINEWLKELPPNGALDIAREFYAALGIDIDSYGFTQDLFPRAGKNTHAFAMTVVLPRVDAQLKLLTEPKMDIRFLANLKKPVTWGDVSTIIHELAHAIHGAEVRQPVAVFRGIGSVETEALAMLAERMAASSEFFEGVLPKYSRGVTPKKMKPAIKRLVEAQAAEQAFVLMRQAFFSDFEYHLYRDVSQNFAALWSKLHKEWWGVELAVTDADWDVEHFLMAPVYVENYAIGIVMVEQLYETILKQFGTSYRSKALGDKLRKDVFGPGTQYDYLQLVERFTAKPLTAAATLRLLP